MNEQRRITASEILRRREEYTRKSPGITRIVDIGNKYCWKLLVRLLGCAGVAQDSKSASDTPTNDSEANS